MISLTLKKRRRNSRMKPLSQIDEILAEKEKEIMEV